MKLIKYDNAYADPFSTLDKWFSDSFFRPDRFSIFNDLAEQKTSRSVAINIYEDEENYYLTAEVPGFSKKEVNVELENSVLTISGERKTKKGKSEYSESFSRSVTVGDKVNGDKVKAKLEDGVLTVTLPRREESKPKSINVS